ncbi:MAG: TRAP transporter small permease subunit [Spirochaetes bacterium]|nr:TRAP transporter small permease subunit [Spirochaetota bacterium]
MIRKILDFYILILEKAIVLLMIALLLAVALQILGRYVPFIPRFLWTVEVSNFSLVWVIFLGSIIGVKESKHFYVNFLPDNLSPFLKTTVDILYYLFMYGTSMVFVIFGPRFFEMGYIQHSEYSGLNLGAIYISVPFSGISWVIFITYNLFRKIRKESK